VPEHTDQHAEPVDAAADTDIMRLPAPDFDVRAYAAQATGSHRDTLDLGAYADAPLRESTLRALAYLQVAERSTMTHLRSVLVTATHKDARITAFLATWAFEKYWIADALDQVVRAHPDFDASVALRHPHESTIRESVYANIVGVPMIAVHMALGTVDEWLTQAAAERIAVLDPHPALVPLMTSFSRIKHRQLQFFEPQARYRLTDSSRGRRIARRRLARSAWPIGAKSLPRDAARAFYADVFTPELVAELDARVDTLPGMRGLGLIAKAAR
jgi:hypothetical protein